MKRKVSRMQLFKDVLFEIVSLFLKLEMTACPVWGHGVLWSVLRARALESKGDAECRPQCPHMRKK